VATKDKPKRETTRKSISTKGPAHLPKGNYSVIPDPSKKVVKNEYAAEMQAAAQLEVAGRLQEAESIYQQIVNLKPDFAPAWHSLGMLAYSVGKHELALQLVSKAVDLDKKSFLFQRNLGEMSRRFGRLSESIAAGEATVKLAPLDVDAHFNLGLAYTDAKDYTKAVAAYKKALKLNPKHGLSWNNLGSALEQSGNKDEALEAYIKAAELNPQHSEAQNNLGAIYSEQGLLEKARTGFEAAIDAKKDFVEAHYNLSQIKTYTLDDPHLSILENANQIQHQFNDHVRIRYNFALGKALDDIGQYDRAFAAYALGNELQHALLPVDEIRADQLIEEIFRTFNSSFFEERKGWSKNSSSPIFIVGMPRSGTTLLEQILASHPSVYGAGELSDFNDLVTELVTENGKDSFANRVVHLDKKSLQKIGDEYVKRVWKLSPDSTYITDKMPANFFYIGLIHLIIPNAKIINAMRDPMDSCFSCYSRLFNDSMDFAYDLGTLGRYFVRYMRLMQHWESVLPPGTILNLAYEDLIADTEGQAKRITEYIGLPWDAECLKFYENDRLVKTASIAQVRKPIYKTSLARWKHFARHLLPLYEIVKDYRSAKAPEFPKEALAQIVSTKQALAVDQFIQRCLQLQNQNNHSEALALLEDAVRRGEQSPQIWHLLGISLYRLNRFQDSQSSYERALQLEPNFPAALNSYGFLLQDMGYVQEAKNAFEKAVQIAPEFSMARLNLGMAQLKLGDWEAGWDNYESRWTGSAETVNANFKKPECPLPQWDGQAGTENQNLLIITEQGFGDIFQFARFLKLATQKFTKVGFISSSPSLRILEWSFGDKVVLLNRMPADYSTWHWYIPLMSLPRALKTRLDNLPVDVPYLGVSQAAKNHWRDRLEHDAPGRFRVGIAWAGRKTHQYDGRRSIQLQKLLPVLQGENITWVSLQKWAPEEGRPQLPDSIDWIDWTEELTDFADTAALISNLDLIISVDSSMVHLAGALGKPVWMLNRFDSEWRWLIKRSDSPWYPNLRIFNQPQFGNWDPVLMELKQSLQQLNVPQVPAKKRIANTQNAALVKTSNAPMQSPLTIDQAMQVAGQLQGAGRIHEAEQVLRQVLAINPKHAHALHLLGVVSHQQGRGPLACQLIKDAIAIEPKVALFHCNLTEMSRQMGRHQDAIYHGEQAIQLDPSMAMGYSNLGIAFYDNKEFVKAKSCHERALALAPNMLQSLNNMGSIARAEKDKNSAIEWYQRVISIAPDYLESLSNLGAVLVELDRADEAIPILQKALSLNESYPEVLCNLGLARLKRDEIDIAGGLLERCLQLRPGYPEGLTGLARIFNEQDRLPEAEQLLLTALKNAPDKVDARCQLAAIYTELGKASAAEALYQEALVIEPDSADAFTGLGNLSLEAGNIELAEEYLNNAIQLQPDNLDARFHLTQIKKVEAGSANLIALEAAFTGNQRLTNDRRISLHYALGKAYDDLHEYDKAFENFSIGAKLKRAKLHYSAAEEGAYIDQIIATFTPEYFKAHQGGGSTSSLPIFVLGMPRSGTTLTEQILASHPDVFGAGELSDLIESIEAGDRSNSANLYPNSLQDLGGDKLTQWGKNYIARLNAYAPNALHITDKMPSNYMLLGLIPLMLPNAKIIHVKRNPIDTCLSCFTRLFNRHQSATYDLHELAEHYKNYMRLMNHWRKVLPEGSFLEVQYEDIVADIEAEARRLVEYCQLEWDDSCLEFYNNKRQVRTASVAQVRKPIYKQSVERWRNYEKHLTPLLDALGKEPGNIPMK
jgi:tetratricopeptide (TPR) repeat protein